MLCFGWKQREGGCHIFWFAWYENSSGFAINGTCGLFGVKWDFLLGCLHLDAICQLYCGRPGSVLAWFYSKFVMGPIQEWKVNMVIYLHAHKQAHFVRRLWWLLVWKYLVWLLLSDCQTSCEGGTCDAITRWEIELPSCNTVKSPLGDVFFQQWKFHIEKS